MKITHEGWAVLDDGKDAALSRYVERDKRLCHDAGVAAHYLPHIQPGSVCVDAGAAIGDHTISYIQKTGDPKLVHAFECSPLMLECLRYNCPECHIHPFALSDKHETLFFHHLNENAGGSYADTHETGGVKVQSVTLDSYQLPNVGFIKLDVEGYEVKAIRGARETILRCRPVIMIEVIPGCIERAGETVEELYTELRNLRYKWRSVIGTLDVPPYWELCCEPLP